MWYRSFLLRYLVVRPGKGSFGHCPGRRVQWLNANYLRICQLRISPGLAQVHSEKKLILLCAIPIFITESPFPSTTTWGSTMKPTSVTLGGLVDARCRPFRFAIDLLILILLFSLAANSAGRVLSDPQSGEERTRNASRLRLLHDRRVGSAEDLKVPGQMGGVPGVTVSIPDELKSISSLFFHDNMEHGVDGWTTEVYEDSGAFWHQSNMNSNSPVTAWWAGIEGQRNYNTGHRIRNALVSQSIDLSGGLAPITVLFTEDYFTEKGWDFCMVDVSSNGGSTWNHLRGGYGDAPSGDSYGWKITTLDLSPYAGSAVQIRFMFDTGDSLLNDFPGWFVDNVAVYDQSGAISGTVFFDANQDGSRDSAEPWLDDWYITASGPITITTRSRMFGVYSFPLPLGSYMVSESVPASWTQTSPPGSFWNINLTGPGQLESDRDFGNHRPFSLIQGIAFDDADRDSTRDSTEVPLQGWEVDLYDSTGNWKVNQYTDAGGEFNFLVFEPGRYEVVESFSSEFVSTIPGGDLPQYTVDMPSLGSVVGGLLFGTYEIPYTATISGYVYNDVDSNGVLDPHEGGLPGRLVEVNGPDNRGSVTDEQGRYAFENLPAGTYVVSLRAHYAWHQTYPESTYTIAVATGEVRDSLVFGTHKLLLGSIRGSVFNDGNRNGFRDSLETGVGLWEVFTSGPEPGNVATFSDSSGGYVLDDLLAGDHTVNIVSRDKWLMTMPAAPYTITLTHQENRDSIDFGVYALRTGSISGTVFNDSNADGVWNPEEGVLPGREVRLSGGQTGVFFTDDSGHYRFDGLWSGSYRIQIDLSSRWRQTLPPLLRPYYVALADEEDRAGVNFGLALDSSFSIAFRTFLPESLALAVDQKGKHKAVVAKPDRCFWRTGPIQPIQFLSGPDSIRAITLVGKYPILPGSVSSSHAISNVTFNGAKTVTVEFSPFVQPYEVFDISATCLKPGRQRIARYQFSYLNSNGPVYRFGDYFSENRLTYPMPNAISVLSYGAGSMLTVGLGGAHSVLHRHYKDVAKSLLEKFDRMHIGDPRCLGVYANSSTRSMTKQLTALSPSKGNNKLFAEAVAFAANIKASDLWITPPGFGDLIFTGDETDQFTGMSLRAIRLKLDSAMSAFDEAAKACLYPRSFFDSLYATIRMINAAFSGPMDTVSFADGLILTPVRALADVPFLRLDSSAAYAGFASRPVLPETVLPERFALEQNYPNPFNPITIIGYSLPVSGYVTLKVYNMLGQEVATVLDRDLVDDGVQEVEFDGAGLASGVYFYRLTVDGMGDEEEGRAPETYVNVRKMILMR
jgi:hypothetical protein